MSSQPPYPTRYYAVGEFLLTLRSRAKLTQAALATRLGIHRRSVQKWESGESYPTAEHLRTLLGLFIELGIFTPEQERNEAVALWDLVNRHAPQQLPPFDTGWFDHLLAAYTTAHRAGQPPSAVTSGQAGRDQVTAAQSPLSGTQPQLSDLPFHTSSLIGRDAELAALDRLLSDPACRLLTLLGPGGIGKTRLALAVAERRRAAFADGVIFVDLVAVTTLDQMVAAIGEALALSFAGQEPKHYLLAHLQTRHLLLLLDDFEQLIEATEFVQLLLQRAPRLTILVTSQARLNLQTEWLFDVEGLAYPTVNALAAGAMPASTQLVDYSAIQLFLQRARQIQPDLVRTAAALLTIAQICQKVAGIPLAIELAAASARSVPLAEIDRQITANLDLLTTTLQDLPPRHRSMRAVFDHAWRLLSAAEQALLSRLAVFRGGWTQAAAEAICDQVTREVAQNPHISMALPLASATFSPVLLAALVDKSLVRRVSLTEISPAEPYTPPASVAPRFIMLEPIRVYALEQLAARGKAVLLQRAHATYYLALAEAATTQWVGPTANSAIAELDHEHDNLRAALQWSSRNADDRADRLLGLRLAGALIKFWRRRGAIGEARAWLEQLLALDDVAQADSTTPASTTAASTRTAPPDTVALAARLRVMQGAAWLASDQHEYARATQLFAQSVELRRLLGEHEDATQLLVNGALQARTEGRYGEATTLLEAALAQQRALDNRGSFDNRGLGLTFFLAGLVQREQGNFSRAIMLFEECVQLHRALGDREGMAIGLLALSDIARDQGNVVQIHQYATESLTTLRDLGVHWATGFVLNNLAWAAYLTGDLPQAFTLISESVALFRAQKTVGTLAEVLITLGVVVWARRDVAAAHAAITEAVQLARTIGPRLMVAVALETLARLTAESGGTMESAALATRFLAAASALRDALGTPRRPIDQPAVAQTLAFIRTKIRPAALDALWAEAAAASLDHLLNQIPGMASFAVPMTLVPLPSPRLEMAMPQGQPQIDWGLAQDVPLLYGRADELATLTQWVLTDRCRVVTVVGLGGIGKTSLAITLAKQLAPHFSAVVFRSLGEAPPCPDLLDQLIHSVATEQQVLPAHLSAKLALLIDLLRQKRCLLILDNLETLLQAGLTHPSYLAGYEGYGALFKACAETTHQSCVLLTSRERPQELAVLEGTRTPVRSLRLAGLAEAACRALLADQELGGTVDDAILLAQQYGGNPLALKLVADPIRTLFRGDVAAFLAEGNLFFNGVGQLLAQQIGRVSSLEQELLLWLALAHEPVALDQVAGQVIAGTPNAMPRTAMLATLHALWHRNLLELGQTHLTFALQPVVLEYLTDHLVTQVVDELATGQFDYLQRFALIQATAKEYIRHSQERLIGAPILACLSATHGNAEAVAQHLQGHFAVWRGQPPLAQGYGPGNILNLLRLLQGNLRHLDLSHLAVRQLYLQGVALQNSTFAESILQECVFTETFDDILAVVISATGTHWAAASRRGEIRVWEQDGLILRRTWRAHVDMIWALACSPDGRTLASGGWDGKVKVWEIASGALLWVGSHTNHLNSVAYSPDGRRLASSGHDAVVQIWELATGKLQQTLAHPHPVFSVTWSPDGRLLASGDMAGDIRLWAIAQPATTNDALTYRQTLSGHTGYVDSLAFTPESNLLASGSWDKTVKLWEIVDPSSSESTQSAHLHATLSGHRDRVRRAVWSPDGRTLASSGRDQQVWLWSRDQGAYRTVLHGHTAEVWTVAFTPDGYRLLTGSEDGRLRLWDVASGQCTRVVQGHAAALYDVDWSPDGTAVVGGGLDGLVAIYPLKRETATADSGNVPEPPRIRTLHEHGGVVFGMSWGHGPTVAGQRLAGSQVDDAVCLWDPVSGDPLDQLRYANDVHPFFRRLAWSPDGARLAIGTYRNGLQIFTMTTPYMRWAGEESQLLIRHVAWSPDGASLAGAGDDGIVYLWDAGQGTLRQRLAGHQRMITSVAWSPDGATLASGGRGSASGELFVWDPTDGQRVKALAGHTEIVSAVAWGVDRDCLISGGGGGKLRWWDLPSGDCLRTIEAHQGTVHALRRSPDGTKVASCGDDGAIMIWDLQSGDHLQTLRRDRPYERLDITGVQGLTAAQMATLRALGAA